jgi:hypothetical protein
MQQHSQPGQTSRRYLTEDQIAQRSARDRRGRPAHGTGPQRQIPRRSAQDKPGHRPHRTTDDRA